MRFFPCSNPMKTAAVRSSKILNSRSRESLNYHANKYSALKPQESIQFFKQSPIPPGSSKFLRKCVPYDLRNSTETAEFLPVISRRLHTQHPSKSDSGSKERPSLANSPERGRFHSSERSTKHSSFSLSINSNGK